MSYVFAILGIIQGLTEFIPVSSSAHLVFIQKLLKFDQPGIVTEVLLHFGTVLSLIVFLWKDILALIKNLKLVFLVLVATLTTTVFVLPVKNSVKNLFDNPLVGLYSGIFLVITGG
ncbi:MAG: undecaprenyl-diphosphate phosphatase, partial [Elusimicrobiota bacterium]|nr:undecaprenyl-diphosphate phosphatase [Elusimicrobiota bacterium]